MDAFWIAHPFYVLSKLFGHSTYTAAHYKSPLMKLIDQVLSHVAVFVNLSIFVLAFFLAPRVSALYSTRVGSTAYLMHTKFYCITLAMVVVINWLFRGRILEIIHKLNTCDRLLANVHLRVSPKYQRLCVVRTMILVLVATGLVGVLTAMSSIFYYNELLEILIIFSFLIYNSLATQVYVLMVEVFAGAVWFRLRTLNCGISEHFFGKGKTVSPPLPSFVQQITVCAPPTAKSTAPANIVLRFADIHHLLCDIVDESNSCLSFQLMLLMTCNLTGLLVSAYYCYESLLSENESSEMSAFEALWLLLNTAMVILLIVISTSVTREARNTATLLHKVINCGTRPEANEELRNFSQQLVHRTPSITCGPVTIDWSLLYSMFGGCVTYLILLIQFNTSTESCRSKN